VFPIISYGPLWETMKRKNISQYQLLRLGIDNKTLSGLRHNKNITLLTLEKICNLLNCKPEEVFEFVKDED